MVKNCSIRESEVVFTLLDDLTRSPNDDVQTQISLRRSLVAALGTASYAEMAP